MDCVFEYNVLQLVGKLFYCPNSLPLKEGKGKRTVVNFSPKAQQNKKHWLDFFDLLFIFILF